MASGSHGPVSVLGADNDLLMSGRLLGGLASRSSEEATRRAHEDQSGRPPVVDIGDENEPSSPQAEQLFRARRSGSHASSPAQRPDEEQEPSNQAVLEHADESENEPSSPQAEQLVRLKRAAAGSQTSSPGQASSLGRTLEEGDTGGRQDVNSSSVPAVSDDEPSSPQAQQLFRIKRSAAGSQTSSPASRREESELPAFDAEDLEPSSPQAEQLLRIRRAGAGSQSTSPAPSRQAPEESVEAEDTSEPNSPVRQRSRPGVAARNAPEASRPPTAVGRVDRPAGHDNESRSFDMQHSRGEIQFCSSEGFGQDELDTLTAAWQDARDEEQEEVSSPSATRLLQAKRAQQSRGAEWGVKQSSPEHSVSSAHEEERPYLPPDDDEPCSPQADSMQRIKAGAARRRQMSPTVEVDRQENQMMHVYQQGGKVNHNRDFGADMHQAQRQSGPSLPVSPAGTSSAGVGMLQGDLDRICVEAGDENGLSEPSSPVAQLLLRAKHSKSVNSSPGSALDTSDGDIGRATIGSVASAQSITRKVASSGSPLAFSGTQGISQDELDNLSRSVHAPSGEELWQAEEPSSPQADQLRRAKAQARVTGHGFPGRHEESSSEVYHVSVKAAGGSQPVMGRDGFTQNELDSLSRASSRTAQVPVGNVDEVSSPTATQLRRAKRSAQQASRQADLSVADFAESIGLEGSGSYEEGHQEEPSSPCAAQIRRAKKMAQSHSGSSPASTAYHEDSSPGSASAIERRPHGITQAELDAFSRYHSVGEEEPWQGEAPSSPLAQQLRRAKRNGGTPPRAGWAHDSTSLGQDDLSAFPRSNRSTHAAHSSSSGQPEMTQLPTDRFHGDMEDFGSPGNAHPSYPAVRERSGSEDAWQADDGPSSPQAQKHLRAKRMAQQGRGPINHSAGEDPWRESRPEPPEAWPCRGATSSVGASSHSQFRTPPSPTVQTYGAGLTQAELDSLANHSPVHSPVHSTSPSERGIRSVEPDVGRPASSMSEIPPPIQFSAGLSQAELNALCQEPRLPNPNARLDVVGDDEPVSPQASRMQQIRRAQQYAPVGGAPWA